MGASSSKSDSASKEYDVFISFRGEDTRHNFISHLFAAFERKSIQAYIDYKLNKGDEISTSLTKAIEDSYGSLVVFSENYASSKWCLNELLQILECRKQGHFVIPVFYHIDPSHVRKQTLSIHEQDPRHKDKLQLWKNALTEAANIAGWDSQSRTNRDEYQLIQNIVDDILQKMNHIYQPSESSFVGIDKYCKEIELLLQRSPHVGIWGMGGVGKTTIAKVVFRKLFFQYDSYYFFENVREESKRKGINFIRNKLLSELLKEDFCSTTNTLELEFAMRRLSSKKVLIVLDDVNNLEQLEHLQQDCKFLGVDSKVIITTRDKGVLVGLGLDPEMIYRVEGLKFEKSLQLFCLNAFNENYPNIGYEEITEKLVGYAGGLPLALKVLGSFLRTKSKEEWESALARFKKFPHDGIQKVLKLSYDALHILEQQIFLDIACLLKGEHIEHVINLLDKFGFFGCIGIKSLQEKALVTIGYNGCVDMHDLLQEMGQDIVCRESIESPGKRSRLWNPEEVFDVLKNNEGSTTIKGIQLNMSQIKDLHLKADAFKKMTNLRFLNFYSSDGSCKIHLPEGIESFSNKIRYFRWDQFPCHSLPSTICPETLVELHISNSPVAKLWDGLQDVKNLKKLNLRGCNQLMELPDLSNALELKWVYLSECTKLCHIHPSILHLDSLVELFVNNCKNLVSLRNERHLKSLEWLNFNGCSSLREFSLSTEKLEELCFDGTAIEMVPSSIGLVETLQFMDPLKKVPSQISRAISLRELCIWDGSEFDPSGLHVLFDAFPCLEKLHLINCVKSFQLPDNVSILSSLNVLELSESSVESLPTSMKHLSCLKHLIVSNCQRLRSLPELPPSLIELDLSGSNVESLPTSIMHLSCLKRLIVHDCQRLGSLPEVPPSLIDLDVSGSSVESLPKSIKHLLCLRHLIVHNCQRLRSLPELPPFLIKLELSESSVESLPTSMKHLLCLKHLIVSNCQRLWSLPEFPPSLIGLDLSGSNVESLPTSIMHLSCLKHLIVSDCQRLRSLPELPPSMVKLVATNCLALETLIPSTALWYCDLSGCVKLDKQSLYGIMAVGGDRVIRVGQTDFCWLADTIPQWFSYRTMQSKISIELLPHSHLLCFVFCFIFSVDVEGVNCVCYLEDSGIVKYFSERACYNFTHHRFMANNVYLWCGHEIADSLNALEKGICGQVSFQICSTNNYWLKKTDGHDLDYAIKEFSVWPIYASDLELLEANEQQLPLTKKLIRFPLELELDLNTESCAYLGNLEIEMKGSGLESQEEKEIVLIDKKILREFIFQPLPTESWMLNDSNEIFDFFPAPALGDKLKRCWCELEVDEQQPFLAKKFNESTLEPAPYGLELELTTNSYTYLEIEGIQVGGCDHEKQDEQEPIRTEKGIQGI